MEILLVWRIVEVVRVGVGKLSLVSSEKLWLRWCFGRSCGVDDGG